MYSVFCQRLEAGRIVFRMGSHECVERLFPFGCRSVSSSVEGVRQPKEKKPEYVEACQAYLVKSWGLCPKFVENISKRYLFDRLVSRGWGSLQSDRADAVLKSLRDHNFDDTQVAKIVRVRPHIIFIDAEKVIQPKLKFLSSIWIQNEDLTRIITREPSLLSMSLEKSLVPKLEFLKTILVDNDDLIKAITHNPRIFYFHCDSTLAPNLTTLREVGVPQHLVRHMMIRDSIVVTRSRDKFIKCLDEVTKMGFHPKKWSFISAMRVFSTFEATRDRKIDILNRYGMSESEIQNAIKKHPQFMLQSDEKLLNKMKFLVKDMRWTPSDIARYPYLLSHSLENKLMPRSSVIRLLQSEGLIRKDLMLSAFLKLTEKAFHDKFIADYLDKIPQLLDVYQRKMSPSVLPGTKQPDC